MSIRLKSNPGIQAAQQPSGLPGGAIEVFSASLWGQLLEVHMQASQYSMLHMCSPAVLHSA